MMKIGHKDVEHKDIEDVESARTERGAHPAVDEPMTEPVATDRPTHEPVAAGTSTGEPVPAGQSVEPKSPVARENSGLFSDHEADGYLSDWRSLQAAFVDDPQAAVGQAEALVGRIVDQASARISERRAALSAMRTDTTGERTEQLRQTLRGYRALVEQLLPR